MNEERQSAQTPEEEYEAAALELAVYRLLKQENDSVRERMSEEEEAELAQAVEKSSPRILKRIDRQMGRTESFTRFWKRSLSFVKAAALFVLVLNMGFSIATAASSSVRARVIEFLMEINESYISIGYSENGEEAFVPEEWQGGYYPTYIPQGYTLQQCASHVGVNMAQYSGAEENWLMIKECDTRASSNINVEGAEVTYISLHGATAIVLRQPYEEVNVIWSIGDRYFIVSGCDYDTVLKVAESMSIIRK